MSYILFTRMQTSDVYVVGERTKYLDPLAICKARHNGPNTWKNDHDVFKQCQTPKEIAAERRNQLKESMKLVAAYIAKMVREWQEVADCIFVPYNIKYV